MNLFENNASPLTLRQFNLLLRDAVASHPELRMRWVTAELSDVRMSGGHCYMVLIEKDEQGRTVAAMRANIWRNVYGMIAAKFRASTGAEFRSGIKLMLRGSATFHEQFGTSFNVVDIDPSYTLGDMERIRREILAKLAAEGVLNRNKMLQMPLAPQRIAVISAPGAAGYGDFMNQLEHNSNGIVFYTHIFESIMQGERVPASVMAALEQIEMTIDLWDCVVIIRGGGSTSDLNGFDNLELARAVATFPLPIIVGIGHERDRTVLDEIANVRVKTPTAAAEWLLLQAADMYSRIDELVRSIVNYATAHLSGSFRQLSSIETSLHTSAQRRLSVARSRIEALEKLLPSLTSAAINKSSMRLDNIRELLRTSAGNRLKTESQKINYIISSLGNAISSTVNRENMHLARLSDIVKILDPINTLKRGYSITSVNGKALRDTSSLKSGDSVKTRLADGEIISVVTDIANKE
jgi:exodeoxyribonuclease VII large subunit